MNRRLFITVSAAACIILALGAFAWMELPSLVTFLLGRAMGGRVEAGRTTISWNRGAAIIELNDVTLSGNVRGNLKNARLEIGLGRGIYIRHASASDFDVTINTEKRVFLLPVQLEYAEALKGKAVYKKQIFTINSITVRNFNTKGQFQFSLDGGIEGFGKIRTRGSGGGVWLPEEGLKQ